VSLFAINLLLAVTWALATGALSERNLALGFVIGMAILQVVGSAVGDGRYVLRLIRIVLLVLTFLKELTLSSVRLAIDVLRPHMRMRPAVIAVPLDLKSDVEITLLANLISLTPGTLTIDVAKDRSCLYVHAMYGGDPDQLSAAIKATFERRIEEAFR